MFQLNKKKFYIVLILTVAFLLRMGAVDYGLPHFTAFGDELVHIAAGFNLLAQKTLRANFDFYYLPPLFSYLLAPIFVLIGGIGIVIGKFQGLAGYQNFVVLNKEYFLTVSRIISALFGTAAIYFLFLLAKRIFNQKIAYVAAILMVFDFFSVHESQIGRIWMPLTFFMLGSSYFIYRLYKEGDLKWYLLSGLMIGLGFGMGYAAAILPLWFLVAHFVRRQKIFNKKFILGGSLMLSLIGFFVYLNSVALRLFAHIIFTIGTFFNKEFIFSPIDIPEDVQSNYVYFQQMLSFLWNNSPLFFLSGLAGFLILAFSKKERFAKLLLIGVPAVYLFIITFLFSGIEGRYVLPAIPFFIISSAYGAVFLSERFFRSDWLRNTAILVLVLIFVSYSFYISFLYILRLQKPDTRIQLVNWLYQNVRPESWVVLWDDYIEINETKRSILFIAEKYSSRLDVKRKYLLGLKEDDYPWPRYNIFHSGRLDFNKINFEEIKADYLIISFWSKEEKKSKLDFFSYQKQLVKEFYPREEISLLPNLLNDPNVHPFLTLRTVKYLGPYVEVYKLQ